MTRGFYVVTTQGRVHDLNRFLHFLLKFNKYPVFVAVADDRLDAHRKKASVGVLSPFDSTVMLDTDMLINGDLTPLFEIAETGAVGVYDEGIEYYGHKVYNSGVVALRKDVASALTSLWLPAYEEHVSTSRYRDVGSYDQFVLDGILSDNKDRFRVFSLPSAYNYILKHHTVQREAADFNSVKIFHFLHDNSPTRPVRHEDYKSYKIYNGV